MKLVDLDECVVSALELFISKGIPRLNLGRFKRPLVVGSGNAAVTGRIIFEGKDVIIGDESTYLGKLGLGIDGGILISASGGKHAPLIAKELKKRRKKVVLLTNNANASAKDHVDKMVVFPKQAEPYTYNTSTYMGMILGQTREDPKKILSYIKKLKISRTLGKYDSFYLIVPAEFDSVRELFMTKFDELFGPKISGRVFTPEQTKHAKTVVPSTKEMFISFGTPNKIWGSNRMHVPLPSWAGPATIMAIGYYVIGKIQKANPAYFKKNIKKYTDDASKLFGQTLSPIVE